MWSANWLHLLTNVWIQPSNFCLSHRLRLIWKIGLSVIQDQKSQGKSGNFILEWKVKAFRNQKSIKGGGQKIRLNHINRRTNAPETRRTWSYSNIPSSWRILSHSFLKHESPSWRGDFPAPGDDHNLLPSGDLRCLWRSPLAYICYPIISILLQMSPPMPKAILFLMKNGSYSLNLFLDFMSTPLDHIFKHLLRLGMVMWLSPSW